MGCVSRRFFFLFVFFFFFQAEDGIRDFHVTGVQTCALPIYVLALQAVEGHMRTAVGSLSVEDIYRERQKVVAAVRTLVEPDLRRMGLEIVSRSEERRVGKECRSGWAR